jgi:hypothetical protein
MTQSGTSTAVTVKSTDLCNKNIKMLKTIENQGNKPVDKNTLNIVNSPFNEFAPDNVEQLFRSPKSTTRET